MVKLNSIDWKRRTDRETPREEAGKENWDGKSEIPKVAEEKKAIKSSLGCVMLSNGKKEETTEKGVGIGGKSYGIKSSGPPPIPVNYAQLTTLYLIKHLLIYSITV